MKHHLLSSALILPILTLLLTNNGKADVRVHWLMEESETVNNTERVPDLEGMNGLILNSGATIVKSKAAPNGKALYFDGKQEDKSKSVRIVEAADGFQIEFEFKPAEENPEPQTVFHWPDNIEFRFLPDREVLRLVVAEVGDKEGTKYMTVDVECTPGDWNRVRAKVGLTEAMLDINGDDRVIDYTDYPREEFYDNHISVGAASHRGRPFTGHISNVRVSDLSTEPMERRK